MPTVQMNYQPLIEFLASQEQHFLENLQNIIDFVAILGIMQPEYAEEFGISNSLHSLILFRNSIQTCKPLAKDE